MRYAIALVLLVVAAQTAHAQGAWVGDPGSLSGSLAYSYVPSEAIVLSPDLKEGDRPTRNHIVTVGLEYVPIEGLSIEASLPIASVKYAGETPHLPAGAWDDNKYHTTLTDLRAAIRYQVLLEPIALTPYLAGTLPVVDYEVQGFATGGRGLKQVHFGASVGRTLDPVLPNAFVMAGYEFTLSEKYDENPMTAQYTQNRSDVAADIGYLFLDGDLGIAASMNYRTHHGGVDFTQFLWLPPEITGFHDPILQEEWVVVGGGATYSLTTTLSVSAFARFFVWGWSTREQQQFGLELSWRAL